VWLRWCWWCCCCGYWWAAINICLVRVWNVPGPRPGLGVGCGLCFALADSITRCSASQASHLISAQLISSRFLTWCWLRVANFLFGHPKYFFFDSFFFCVSGRTAFTEWAQGLARLIKRPEIHTFAHLANLRLCSTVAPAVYLSLPAHARTAIIIIVELWSDLSKVRSQCKLANKNLYISILFIDHLHLRWWEELLNRMTCFEQRDKSQLTRQCHTKNGKYSTENVF